jgi:3-hydroxymyristoyl/3-hydroxydecanoyl-(acyl carrier protein) dehydratase
MLATKAVISEALYPEIISSTISAHSLDLTLYVAENLCCFAGHFPGLSILPGVVQLSWAVHYAQEFLGLIAPVMNVERLKFTCPIQPNMQVLLHIDYDIEKNSANFCFRSPQHSSSQQQLTLSQGRLIYARGEA